MCRIDCSSPSKICTRGGRQWLRLLLILSLLSIRRCNKKWTVPMDLRHLSFRSWRKLSENSSSGGGSSNSNASEEEEINRRSTLLLKHHQIFLFHLHLSHLNLWIFCLKLLLLPNYFPLVQQPYLLDHLTKSPKSGKINPKIGQVLWKGDGRCRDLHQWIWSSSSH